MMMDNNDGAKWAVAAGEKILIQLWEGPLFGHNYGRENYSQISPCFFDGGLALGRAAGWADCW